MATSGSFSLTTLDNGLRVVSHVIPASPKSFMKIDLDAGSRDEFFGDVPRGTSHAREHSAFNGSRHYAPREAAATISSLGGQLNAATDFDSVFYYASVPAGEERIGFHALSDIVCRPSFLEVPSEEELSVIENE